MRRRLLLSAVTFLALGALYAHQVLSRDRRYQELILRGDESLQGGLAADAIRNYSEAIALEPGEPLAYLKRADAQGREGGAVLALSDLEKAAELGDEVLLVESRLAELYYASDRFDEAADRYEKILDLVPDSPGVLYWLGLARFRAGREVEAIEALNRAAHLRPDFWEAYYLRGAVFRAIGGADEAVADFETALEIDPGAEPARKALVELYLDEKRPEPALALLERQIVAHPEEASSYLQLAEAHRLAGRTIEAIEAVGRALLVDPNIPAAYVKLGELWLEEADRGAETVAAEKALAALSTAVEMDPASGPAALARGRAYLALGDEERGFEELQRASRATPIEPEALRLLGDLYRALRNPAEAVTAYHVYLKLAGDSPAVLERLGDAYLESGNPQSGAEAYMKLAALEPRRAAPLLKAAEAYLLGGNVEAARRACRKGLAANPENPSLLALLSKL